MTSKTQGIRVTATDLETGEESTAEIMDNYVIITAGTCHVAHEQWSDGGRTVQLTIKGGRNGASRAPASTTPDSRPCECTTSDPGAAAYHSGSTDGCPRPAADNGAVVSSPALCLACLHGCGEEY